MSEQHTALLKKARDRLIEDRRDLAKTIAAPFEREKTRDAREKFVDIQAVIEAVTADFSACVFQFVDFEVGAGQKLRRKVLDCKADGIRSTCKSLVSEWRPLG
jgi:hypothetical protein